MVLYKKKELDLGRNRRAYLMFQMYATKELAEDDSKRSNGDCFVSREITENQIRNLLGIGQSRREEIVFCTTKIANAITFKSQKERGEFEKKVLSILKNSYLFK